MERENYRIDDSSQAKDLFGGRVAVKYMGQYQMDQCIPKLPHPINICQKLNLGLNQTDLISNITLPEPNNRYQHEYLANLFRDKISSYNDPNNPTFYWLGFFTEYLAPEEGLPACMGLPLTNRRYNYISDPAKQVKWSFSNLWLPNEPNECAETGLVSNYNGMLADLDTTRTSSIWCVYVEETSNKPPDFCSIDENSQGPEINPDYFFE